MYNEEVKKISLRMPVSLLNRIDSMIGPYPCYDRTATIHYLLKKGIEVKEGRYKKNKKFVEPNQGVQTVNYEEEVLRSHFDAIHEP